MRFIQRCSDRLCRAILIAAAAALALSLASPLVVYPPMILPVAAAVYRIVSPAGNLPAPATARRPGPACGNSHAAGCSLTTG